MRQRNRIAAIMSALLIGVAVTGGILAQSRDGTVNEGVAKKNAEKIASEKVTAAKAPTGRARPIDVDQCTILLLDEVTLACDRPGIVAFVKPREGDQVREGDTIAGLHDEVARATLAIAELEATSDVDIRYAEKAGEVAATEHRKVVEANNINPKTFPEVEVLRLKLASEKTQLELESAKHRQAVNRLKRDEAQAQLETLVVKAPFSGVVTRVHRKTGEAVKQGDQVLDLASTDRVRVEGMIDVRDIWNIRTGMEVQVQLDIPRADLDVEKLTFTGRLVFIDVKIEPVGQKVRVWAEVANPDNVLRAGLFARMTIIPDKTAAPSETK